MIPASTTTRVRKPRSCNPRAAAALLAVAPALWAAEPPAPGSDPGGTFQFDTLDQADAEAARQAAPRGPAQPWNHWLPFFADSAIALGAELPLPYGLGITYTNFSEDMKLDNLVVSTGNGARAPIDFIDLNNAKVKSQAEQARVDAWVLPFMNVFAFVGNTDSKSSESFAVPGAALLNYLGRGSVCTQVPQPAVCSASITGTLNQDNSGLNYGVGTLLAAGVNHWFGIVALSYNWTDLSGVDTKLDALTVSPRVGYQFTLNEGSKLAAYAGSLYVHSKVRLTGTTTLSTGAYGAQFAGDIPATFTVTESNKAAWSYVAGASWDITRRWTLQADGNFGPTRSGAVASLVFRY